MKSINIVLEDAEFEMLESVKKGKTWRELILTLVQPKNEVTEP